MTKSTPGIFLCLNSTFIMFYWLRNGISSLLWGISYLLTYSTQHSPSWEANWFIAIQEIPRNLWNPKIHCRIHKGPPAFPILSQNSPVHAPTSHLLKIHLTIIIIYRPGKSTWSLFLSFFHQTLYIPPLPHTSHMFSSSQRSRFVHPKMFDDQYRSLSSSLCSFLH